MAVICMVTFLSERRSRRVALLPYPVDRSGRYAASIRHALDGPAHVKYSFGIFVAGVVTASYGVAVMSPGIDRAPSVLEYHLLLALAAGPLYGWAIKDAIAAESAGALSPRAGSLYRVLARTMSAGLVTEAEPDDEPPPHPGHARRYYALTAAGRRTLAAEARRLKQTAAVAEKRLGMAPGRS
jgi:PadR family transcriptional regulator